MLAVLVRCQLAQLVHQLASYSTRSGTGSGEPEEDGVSLWCPGGSSKVGWSASMPNVDSVIQEIEAADAPTEVHKMIRPFRARRREMEELGEEVPEDLLAEEIAFTLHEARGESVSEWGLYFGPMASWTADSGERVHSPSLELVTPSMLAYWRGRVHACRHPLMRARYADLLWELPRALDHTEPDHEMARVAVASYVEAATNGWHEHSISAVQDVQRAVDVALSLRDSALVTSSVQALIDLEGEVADDESLGLWGFSFDRVLLNKHPQLDVPSQLEDTLVQDLEGRVERLSAQGPSPMHPFGLEAAATRLAQYYRAAGRMQDVRRVMGVYAAAVQGMDRSSAPMIRLHSLEKLYDQLRGFGLHDDARALDETIRSTSRDSLEDMKPVQVSHEVSRENVEEFYRGLLGGDPEDVMIRLAAHFIPDRQRVEDQVRSLAAEAPLLSMMSTTLKDHEGRTVATVGSVDHDFEGHVARQVGQNLQLGAPWLREAMSRAMDQQVMDIAGTLQLLKDCVLIGDDQEPMLEVGLRAYWEGDSIAAIHVLIPQIEHAVRRLAGLVGAHLFSRRSRGGLQYRTLDDLLSDEAVTRALSEDLSTYLRVLLTDPRGWNLRNNVCHGLTPAASLTMPVADRVLHALLALTLVREVTPLDALEWFHIALGLSLRETAELVGCAADTLRRWRHSGSIPPRSPYHPTIRDLIRLREGILSAFGSSYEGAAEVRNWLREEHRDLDGGSPLTTWRGGRREAVLELLE